MLTLHSHYDTLTMERYVRQPWTADEEKALVEDWVQVSYGGNLGDAPNSTLFWGPVNEYFLIGSIPHLATLYRFFGREVSNHNTRCYKIQRA